MAIAEAVWSPKSARNWNNIVERVEKQLPKLDQAGTKYAPSMYEPDFKVSKFGPSGVKVELVPELAGLDMYYSFDNSYPDQYYPKYTAPVEVPKDAEMMRIVTYRNGKMVGRYMNMPVSELRKRAGL